MKLLYLDVKFTAVSEFTIWIGKQNLQFWEDDDLYGIRTFLINLGYRDILENGEEADYLLDGAVYPDWKEIQKKFPNDSLYDQLIQFVKFYQSEFGFDMLLLLKVLNLPENTKKFEDILEEYSIN
ncbi:hypothetical protein RyT2_24060 [Pseudolactococcus yaeyamensis]